MTIPAQAVCALIFHPEDSNYILGVSRKDNDQAFGLVGGKVDPGETHEQAIIRETYEETDFRFTISSRLLEKLCEGEVDYVCTTFVGTINFYPPIDWKGQKPGEGIIKWCTKQELFDGPFGEYNKTLFEVLDFNQKFANMRK